jgi:hypothetical protein
MISVIVDSQESVLAQITPAPEKFGSNDNDVTSTTTTTDSSHHIGAGNENPQGITPSASEKTDYVTEEESSDLTDPNPDGVNNGQTTTEKDDKAIISEEQDPDPTNQLVEAIMNKVDDALSASASGIFGP